MDGDVLGDDDRELGWSGRIFLSLWSGGLDLDEPLEDPRAKNGDEVSVDESAAPTDGHRFREVQRELQGPKPKSRGHRDRDRGVHHDKDQQDY